MRASEVITCGEVTFTNIVVRTCFRHTYQKFSKFSALGPLPYNGFIESIFQNVCGQMRKLRLDEIRAQSYKRTGSEGDSD